MGAAPTTAPAVSFASPAYPHPYDVLLTRSIFARGGNATPLPARLRPGGGGAAEARTPEHSGPKQEPESPFVFRGAMRQDGQFIAFIEDTATGKTQRVSADERIGGGTVRQITLDRLTYESHNKTRDVPVGSTLDGSSAQTQPHPTTQPSNGGTASGAAPAPASPEDEILEKMRKRRQQEEAGK